MFRIGTGHDTHRTLVGRPLILGGVRVEADFGLDGHSDADVVCHALTDALLGALALGDIGDLFSDTDPAHAGADSSRFVQEALRQVIAAHYRIENLDATIFAQAPKLGPVKQQIRQSLAEMLAISIDRVSVKAKTGERVGHIGRGEAIGCQVSVLLTSATG